MASSGLQMSVPCPACGDPADDGARSCPKCGANLEKAEVQLPPSPIHQSRRGRYAALGFVAGLVVAGVALVFVLPGLVTPKTPWTTMEARGGAVVREVTGIIWGLTDASKAAGDAPNSMAVEYRLWADRLVAVATRERQWSAAVSLEACSANFGPAYRQFVESLDDVGQTLKKTQYSSVTGPVEGSPVQRAISATNSLLDELRSAGAAAASSCS
jgi:hypothetical protein